MFLKDILLLRTIKRVQMTEGGTVFLDHEEKTMITVHDGNAPYTTASFAPWASGIRPLLDYLQENGLLVASKAHYEAVQLTHAGWTYERLLVRKAIKFVLCSFVIPCVVAWITAYLVA